MWYKSVRVCVLANILSPLWKEEEEEEEHLLLLLSLSQRQSAYV